MAKNELVLRLNMCFSSFEYKILDALMEEERGKWVPDFDDDKTFTDQEFIEKVWYACVRHGYISEDYVGVPISRGKCCRYIQPRHNNIFISLMYQSCIFSLHIRCRLLSVFYKN